MVKLFKLFYVSLLEDSDFKSDIEIGYLKIVVH